MKNKGFIFIETIIVVCVLTVSLMSLYANYSKIMENTKELNTFDVSEYNYKTFFLKREYLSNQLYDKNYNLISYTEDKCYTINTKYSDNGEAKVCLLNGTSDTGYINNNYQKLDAYIIDYLLTVDLHEKNDNLFLVEYKKEDKQNSGEYLTYISSLNY